jgi:hypothetical protein
VTQAYRDPTFDEVARHEARDCSGCEHLLVMWGKACCVKKKWKGEKNMRRCDMWHYSKDCDYGQTPKPRS